MKAKLWIIGLLVIVIAAALSVGQVSADETQPSTLIAYMVDGNPKAAMLVSEGEYLLPPSWLPESITPEMAKAYFAAPVDGGYLVFKVQLYAIWNLGTCNSAIWRYPCPASAKAYDARGTITFSKTFPAYAMLSAYQNVTLMVATFPDQGPAHFSCEAPAKSTFQNCLKIAR